MQVLQRNQAAVSVNIGWWIKHVRTSVRCDEELRFPNHRMPKNSSDSFAVEGKSAPLRRFDALSRQLPGVLCALGMWR